MTPEQAYERGQRDMRDRIIRQWSGWITDTLGGWHRANRPNRKQYSNVAVMIRAQCKVKQLVVDMPDYEEAVS